MARGPRENTGVTLYAMGISHPSQVARRILDLKGVEYQLVPVAPAAQRIRLRLAGFRGGTVPALKLDGRRVQGSRAIAREADLRWPEPPLFPAEPELRARVEAAERWGEEQLQPIPRRLFRYGVATDRGLATAVLGRPAGPITSVSVPAVQLISGYYARTVEADGRRATPGGVRADVAALPGLLARVDGLIEDGTLALDPPNAATLQILSSVRVLDAFEDLSDFVRTHACASPALQLFGPVSRRVPRFLGEETLAPLRSG